MDKILLYQSAMEWVVSTLVPILGVVLPVVYYNKAKQQREMDKKADKNVVDAKIESLDKSISKIEATQSEYASTQREILDKVTDIWQFLAEGKNK